MRISWNLEEEPILTHAGDFWSDIEILPPIGGTVCLDEILTEENLAVIKKHCPEWDVSVVTVTGILLRKDEHGFYFEIFIKE